MRESCTLGFFYLYFLRSPDIAASGDPFRSSSQKDRLLE